VGVKIRAIPHLVLLTPYRNPAIIEINEASIISHIFESFPAKNDTIIMTKEPRVRTKKMAIDILS